MKKWIFSFVLLTSGAQALTHDTKLSGNYLNRAKVFRPIEFNYVSPESVPSAPLLVKAMKITGFDAQSLGKLDSAFKALEYVVNSDEFKNRVINFKNSKGQRSFASNDGKSNEEIFEIFMDGRETLQHDTSGEMNFFLNLYYKRWSRVVGYTSATTNTININWKYFRNYEAHEVAGNLAHEWTHKLGFDHRSASEHDSAPYAIGYIVEELAEKYLK